MLPRETVQDKEDTDWWTALGLQSLAAAAFLLAPFTGGASLALTAVGVGATATQAAMTHSVRKGSAKRDRWADGPARHSPTQPM